MNTNKKRDLKRALIDAFLCTAIYGLVTTLVSPLFGATADLAIELPVFAVLVFLYYYFFLTPYFKAKWGKNG